MPGPDWQLKPRVHPMTVGTLLDCVTELGAATQGLIDKRALFDADCGARVLQSVVRQMCVPLRKLCLDDDGALLKKVIANPSFHPLGGNKARYRRVTMSWRTERREWEFGYANGNGRPWSSRKQSTKSRLEDYTASTLSKMAGVPYTAHWTSRRRLSLSTLGSVSKLFRSTL